ncbi:hypothetical protein DOTSEDRAFT_70118 [Dothistroma septosporum NZE10]|uniref:Uncharacterized protein n=1 Tax=Dothistroma septosporum (strain NZE10 / CBS 128990) TaxID=675120 RepID=N1PUB3_DOTSN|nr:hypothetical protein DOTSEDRAFT_70118 [Dothistroma septosporum NZE10]
MAGSESQSNRPRAVTQAQFFTQLGLDQNDDDHRRIFALMQQEASAGCRRMIASNRYDSPGQVSETAFRQEVLQVYRTAERDTRRLYDMGVVVGADGSANDNWVVRWMLWQVMHQPNGH